MTNDQELLTMRSIASAIARMGKLPITILKSDLGEPIVTTASIYLGQKVQCTMIDIFRQKSTDERIFSN
ncbi:hypothetical protein B7486_47325 [cyanobacterium TDX16]|nr:hypothetical protein B7486_47325 [cyanobacterium TDX16]